MVQNFILDIEKIFNSQEINFYNEPVFYQIRYMEEYCLNNLHLSSFHTHNGEICCSPNLTYHISYERHYVSFHEEVEDNYINIPVFCCKSDEHYHSVLPSSFIISYCSHSIFFVLLGKRQIMLI